MSSQKIVTQLPIMLETFTDADGSFTTAATFLLLVSSISIGIISVAYLRGNFTGKVLTSRFPPDTVVLHAFARPTLHPGIPSYSAYCLKLETYLRVSSIPYILCTDSPFSKKGKKPYITYNDIQIPDSQFSIKWLQEKYDVSIDKQVMPAGRSAMEAYRSMLEDGIGKQVLGIQKFMRC
ncbi:hypothetical protein BC829DRAFT_72618 [Chytridium lagenaria]|nr:hypothetical protein BC829DRAFT_72618 [Chytridium lagenaria]